MEETLFRYLDDYIKLTEEEQQAVINLNIFKHYKKNDLLFKEGEYTNKYYFILKGCIKCYYLVDGEEKIIEFYTELDGYTPTSTVNHEPSKLYASCIEESIMVVSTSEMEDKIFKEFPRFETLCRKLSEELMVKKQFDFESYKSTSPEERYLGLMKHRPDLIQRIPQYQLASYLGIKPESLSRIRKRLASQI